MTGDLCRDVVELLTDLAERVLPPDVAQRVAEHLADCDPCEQLRVQTARTVRALARLDSAPAAAGAPAERVDELVRALRSARPR